MLPPADEHDGVSEDLAKPKAKWLFRDVFFALILLVVLLIIPIAYRIWPGFIPAWLLLLIELILSTALLLGYPLLISRRRQLDLFHWPSKEKLAREARLFIPLFIAVTLFLSLFGKLVINLFQESNYQPSWFPIASSPLNPFIIIFLASSFILAPISEEVFFRGFLHNALKSRLPLAPAIISQSLLFSLMHGGRVIDSIILFVHGLIFTIIYEWRKTLLTPIFLHTAHNLMVACVILFLMAAFADNPQLGIKIIDHPEGCQIEEVIPGYAAEKAGLEVGDIITEFDDQPIENVARFTITISQYQEGDKVTISVIRNGKPLDLEATLEKRR